MLQGDKFPRKHVLLLKLSAERLQQYHGLLQKPKAGWLQK